MPPQALHCQAVVEMRFQENAFLVYVRRGGPCWIVDPGFAPQHQRLADLIEQHELHLEALLITHGHADHIAGIDDLDGLYPHADLYIGPLDRPMLYDAHLNLSAPFGMPVVIHKQVTRILNVGDRLELDGTEWQVLDTSGHSPGGQSFYCPRAAAVLVGDALFAGSIGRTDFPGSSHDRLLRNIREQLLSLPGQTVVYSGHGPTTTIENERKSNPFLVD